MPDVTFTIGDKPFKLTPEQIELLAVQYIFKTGEDITTVCVSGFTALDVPLPRVPLYLLNLNIKFTTLGMVKKSSSSSLFPILDLIGSSIPVKLKIIISDGKSNFEH
ncbi:hypothetical protein DITRI_Ditri06bG0179400 [Diplodiscus trichospermus]